LSPSEVFLVARGFFVALAFLTGIFPPFFANLN
jgi:hypothetical protein